MFRWQPNTEAARGRYFISAGNITRLDGRAPVCLERVRESETRYDSRRQRVARQVISSNRSCR